MFDFYKGRNLSLKLTWPGRLQVLHDAAQGITNFHYFHKQPIIQVYYLIVILFLNVGLVYLHHGCNIIHRDVKSSNILLSENFEGRMSDFGISKLNHRDTYNAQRG